MALAPDLRRSPLLLALLLLTQCTGGSSGGGGKAAGNPGGAWLASDVGAVGSPGASQVGLASFSVTASGADIWGSADAFRYVYQSLSGDGSITARVVNLDNTDQWAKAGVMIRESLAADSAFAMSVVTPSNGAAFQWRASTGAAADMTPTAPGAAPYWVRLVRSGNTTTGFASADGATWTSLGSRTLTMGGSVLIGLCVTAHNNSLLANAAFDSVTITGTSSGTIDIANLGPELYLVQVCVVPGDAQQTWAGVYIHVVDPATVDPNNHAPAVSSISPSAGPLAPFGSVTLNAAATDSDGDPLRYAWIVPAGQVTGSATSQETWTAPSQPGPYTLQVLVTDGKTWSSGSVVVTVGGGQGTTGTGNHPASIRSLVASATSVTPGTNVDVSVTASDPEGDGLVYAWASATGGTVSGAGTTVTWTAPAPHSGRPARAGLWIWDRTPPAGCPLAMSTDVPGIAFTGRAACQHFCDTWMPTWGGDGNLYSPWQDGVLLTPPFTGFGGFYGASDPVRNGWAKIVGNDPQDLMIADAGMIEGTRAPFNSRWPGANFVHNGVWYYGTYSTDGADANDNPVIPDPGNQGVLCGFVGFRTSTDGGHTWNDGPHTPSNRLFAEPAAFGGKLKFGQMYMVDHGKNQERSPDGKVYFVSNGAVDSDPEPSPANLGQHKGDQIYLCRVTPTPTAVNDAAQYEFYSGKNGAGQAVWGNSLAAAQPIIDWNNHCGSTTMTWNPGLGKYLLFSIMAHYRMEADGPHPEDHDTWIAESSSMTGPWKLVTYLKSFGTQAYYPNLPSKFLSADGRTAWMWYGANYAPFDRHSDPPGSAYRMVQQQIRFLTPGDFAKP